MLYNAELARGLGVEGVPVANLTGAFDGRIMFIWPLNKRGEDV